SRQEILSLLTTGNFDALVGEFETDTLECKRDPYVLANEEQRLQLAKDVSALANGAGGILLIGFATEKDATHRDDRIASVNPIQLAQFNKAQYESLIAQWTWPKLSNVEITIFAEPSRSTHGVIAIDVPQCASGDKPILITQTILDNGRRSDILF